MKLERAFSLGAGPTEVYVGTTGGVNTGAAAGVAIGMTASVARLVGTAPPGNSNDGTLLGAGGVPIVI